MLNQIKEKSDAARVLRRLPDAHLEVFEICNEYLNFTLSELKYINKNSPRYSAIRKGRKKVKKAHKYHLLKWAEVKSRKLSLEAKNKDSVVEKVKTAKDAISIIESALEFYPNDISLSDSHIVLSEFITIVKISNLIEKAEMIAFKGNQEAALEQFNDILFILEKENINQDDKKYLKDKINTEISQMNLDSMDVNLSEKPDQK